MDKTLIIRRWQDRLPGLLRIDEDRVVGYVGSGQKGPNSIRSLKMVPKPGPMQVAGLLGSTLYNFLYCFWYI